MDLMKLLHVPGPVGDSGCDSGVSDDDTCVSGLRPICFLSVQQVLWKRFERAHEPASGTSAPTSILPLASSAKFFGPVMGADPAREPDPEV